MKAHNFKIHQKISPNLVPIQVQWMKPCHPERGCKCFIKGFELFLPSLALFSNSPQLFRVRVTFVNQDWPR